MPETDDEKKLREALKREAEKIKVDQEKALKKLQDKIKGK